MEKWFAIRADASVFIGAGHVMRCLALAEWAKKYQIQAVLITIDLPSSLRQKLSDLKISTVQLPKANSALKSKTYAHSHWLAGTEEEDAKSSLVAIRNEIVRRERKPEFIMVDHYALGAPWENIMSCIAKLLVLDDLCDRQHNCSLLVDQTLGRLAADYLEFVGGDCEVKAGTKYALLRPEFKDIRKRFVRQPPLKEESLRVLITLGGMDADNVTEQVINLLTETDIIDELKICAVIGGNNPNREKLEKLVSEASFDCRLIVNSQNMADLMAKHHICIGAAGSTSWERCVLGMPSVNITLADNQKNIAKQLAMSGAVVDLGEIFQISSKQLNLVLKRFIEDSVYYLETVRLLESICDGFGCERILKIIMDNSDA